MLVFRMNEDPNAIFFATDLRSLGVRPMNLFEALRNAKCTQMPKQLVLTSHAEDPGTQTEPHQAMALKTDCMSAPTRAGSLNSGLD